MIHINHVRNERRTITPIWILIYWQNMHRLWYNNSCLRVCFYWNEIRWIYIQIYGTTIWLNKIRKKMVYKATYFISIYISLKDQRLSRTSGESLTLLKALTKKVLKIITIQVPILINIIGMSNKLKKEIL